jgi:ABC-type Fe3+ transport system substrate-binding protein
MNKHIFLPLLAFLFVLDPGLVSAASPLVIEKAKQEGEVAFYTNINITESKPLLDAFEKKYPFIGTKLTRGAGTAVVTRILTESRAGQQLWDAGVIALIYAKELLQKQMFAPYDSPERKFFRSEFKDAKGFWTSTVVNTSVIPYNTELLRPDEFPKTYEDLLHPRFKGGKISMDTELIHWLAGQLRIRGRENCLELMRKLKAQQPMFRRGRTAQAQSVIVGEVLAAVEVWGHRAQEFKSAGAPLDWVAVEPVIVNPLVAVVNEGAPHPNAARLFVDYILSKEGQTNLRQTGRIPARSDVPPDPPALYKPEWKVQVVGADEDLSKLSKLYAEIFDLPGR